MTRSVPPLIVALLKRTLPTSTRPPPLLLTLIGAPLSSGPGCQIGMVSTEFVATSTLVLLYRYTGAAIVWLPCSTLISALVQRVAMWIVPTLKPALIV